jgi:hypothetical protein
LGAGFDAPTIWQDSFLKLDMVTKQLQLMTSRFFSIILSEGVKSFQKEDPATLNISAQLNEIVGEVSLEGLVQELDSQIAYLGKANLETSK